MKISILVLLTFLTLAACTLPEAFQSRKKSSSSSSSSSNCVCREKECTDVSCEEKNCVCLVKALKVLQNQKDAKYPKKWLSAYLQLVQERCLCIKGCQKICSPSEFLQCSSEAFDRFQCKYQSWLSGIIGDKGYKLFISDITRTTSECINKDCKPICSGNSDCNPFYIEPKDCGCTQRCVEQFILSLIKALADKNVKESLKDFLVYVNAYFRQFSICLDIPREAQKKLCLEMAKDEIDSALANLKTDLVNAAGACSAVSIISAVKQGVLDCAYTK